MVRLINPSHAAAAQHSSALASDQVIGIVATHAPSRRQSADRADQSRSEDAGDRNKDRIRPIEPEEGNAYLSQVIDKRTLEQAQQQHPEGDADYAAAAGRDDRFDQQHANDLRPSRADGLE